jgi:transcriptional regulator with XRE-family HTH domain
MHFGERIKALRAARGMKLRELARRVSLSAGYLSQLENGVGVGVPSQDTIRTLARALEADETELILLAGKMPSEVFDAVQEALQSGRIKREDILSLCRKKKP